MASQKDDLQNELLDTIKEGTLPSDVAKKKGTGGGRKEKWDTPPTKEEIEKAREEAKKKRDGVPPPPPPPPPPGGMTVDVNQIKKIVLGAVSEALKEVKDEMTGLRKGVDQIEKDNEQLRNDVKFWSNNANNYLKNLGVSYAKNDQLEQENKELKRKITYNNLRPQPRSMPTTMTERDIKIIEQAKAHLEHLTNAKTLRERILKAETENTKDAYWELHKDLTSAGLYLDKLIQFFQQDMDEVHSFTYALGATLRGEYLTEN